ncbi:MAG: hypothetical protein WCI37_03095, partial [bacterium]
PWGKHIKVMVLTNVGEQELPAQLSKLDVLDIILKADMTPKQVSDKVKAELDKIINKLLNHNLEEA